MSRMLDVRVVQDPSAGFSVLPPPTLTVPDLTLTLDVLAGDRIRARMSGPALPVLPGGEHTAVLDATPTGVRQAVASLILLWKSLLVDYEPPTDPGAPRSARSRPYAANADLGALPQGPLREAVTGLARRGAYVLFDVLLGGREEAVTSFRGHLREVLSRQDLRIRCDSSDLFLPWPLLCLSADAAPPAGPGRAGGGSDDGAVAGVPPAATLTSTSALASRPAPGVVGHRVSAPPAADPLDALFERFLGHRHQLEHTGDPYPCIAPRSPAPGQRPGVSLNLDDRVGYRTRADDVALALQKGTRFTERSRYTELVAALDAPEWNEELTYFWCHGAFAPGGTDLPHLAIRLSDDTLIDGHTIRSYRRPYQGRGFHPFVLLNACHGAAAGECDRSFLSRVLVESGAQGVLGPLIEMPQAFAAEYALEFVVRYLTGGPRATAGRITLDLARHFARTYHSPFGMAYALHSGMDTHLDTDEGTPHAR